MGVLQGANGDVVLSTAFHHTRVVLHARVRLPPEGLYRIGASQLYVTRGIGTAWAPIRLNASPEVVLLTPADKYRGVKRWYVQLRTISTRRT